jgi:hypothetical protein
MGLYAESPKQTTLQRASIWRHVTPVFPCWPDKSPVTKGGFKEASVDPTQIARWFANNRFLIGVPTSGYIVVDLDRNHENGHDGLLEWWKVAQDHDDVESWVYTYMVNTPSGGRHIWFRDPKFPEEPHRNTAAKLGPGIDTRADGGYVIIPPSQTEKGSYVEHTTPSDPPEGRQILDPPGWLLEMLAPKPRSSEPVEIKAKDSTSAAKYATAAFKKEIDLLAGTPSGGRNHALNKAAFSLGTLVGAGLLDRTEVENALEQTAYSIGLSEWETMRTIESGMGAGIDNPRQIEVKDV